MTNYKPFDLEAAKRGEPCVAECVGETCPPVEIDEVLFHEETCAARIKGGGVFMFWTKTGKQIECNNFIVRMAAPAIPEGWTAYDPNVPPPENAEEIEMVYALGSVVAQERNFFAQDWEKYNVYSFVGRDIRTHYRVTKWKEAKPSLEDSIDDLAYCLDHTGSTTGYVIELLEKLSDAIVQRAVDKSREDRG